MIPGNSLKDTQRAVAVYIERLLDSKVAEVGSSIDKVLRKDIKVGFDQFSDVMDAEAITYQEHSDKITSDKEQRITLGGMTAKDKMESSRLAAQASFEKEGDKLC